MVLKPALFGLQVHRTGIIIIIITLDEFMTLIPAPWMHGPSFKVM